MARIRLPITLEYVGTSEGYATQFRLVQGDVLGGVRRNQRTALGLLLVCIGFGMYAAIKAELFLVAICIAASGASLAKRLWVYSSQVKKGFDESFQYMADRRIRLVIEDGGFRELDCGIETFCPWGSMKNYCLIDRVLFVEFNNKSCALMPATTLKSDGVSLNDVAEILTAHGVPTRLNSDSWIGSHSQNEAAS
jgi:hypothetical protein